MVTPRYWLVGALCLGCVVAGADVIPVTVEATATQAVVKYAPTIPGPCSVQVSESQTLFPVVNDVNPALFTRADSDANALPVGAERWLVVGRRTVERALDGNFYSRALHANTLHYLQITCGSDQGTLSFTTVNPPLGSPPETPLFEINSFGHYGQPTVNFSDQAKTYVDPITGILLKRLTTPGAVGDSSAQGFTYSAVLANGPWTNPGAILGNAGFASYAGAGMSADFLFLLAPINLGGTKGFGAPNVLLDFRADLNGYGSSSNPLDNTLSGCLSLDHGQTCYGGIAIDFPAFPQGAVAAAIEQYPATGYPAPIFAQWLQPGQTPPITPNIQTRTGSLDVTGFVNVTLDSGDTFQDLVPGDWINIVGSGCPNGEQCVIASVTDARHLVLSTLSANLSNASYTANNFGVKVWKKNASGSINLNGARFDWTYDTTFGMPVGGESDNCSPNPANTTVDRNGNPLGSTQSGFLCTLLDRYGNARLYWIGTNGEARHLSNITRPMVTGSAGSKDDAGFLQSMCTLISGIDQATTFDATDPNSLYCMSQTGGGKYSVVYKVTYNPADPTWGNYREWNNNYNLNAENPAVLATNITKASLGMDIGSQIKTFVPSFNSSYFAAIGPGTTKPSGSKMAIAVKIQQNSFGYLVIFDTSTATVTQVHDSWSKSPRWGGMHGGAAPTTPNFSSFYIAPLTSPTTTGIGQYQFTITLINGLSNTALTESYTDAQTCEQLGVTNPQFISSGATGHACILVATDGNNAYNPNPSATDLAAWPHPTHAGWSQLQPAQEGDYIQDCCYGFGENLRLVKIISPTLWVLQRFIGWDCTGSRTQSHANGWTPIFWPQGVCSATFYWFDGSGRVYVDAANMNGSHHDVLTDASSDTGIYVQSGYDIRTGAFPDQVGQEATFSSRGAYAPKFSASTASISENVIQSHPSARQHVSPSSERRWILDGRPYGGSLGGSTLVFYQTVTATSVPSVYLVGPPTDQPGGGGNVLSTLDRKRLPLHVWAGRYLLQDKSGPNSLLTTNDTWMYCVADFAGECAPDSTAGQVYMNVPQADLSGQCLTNFEINTPCWVSASAVAPFITQVGIDKQDSAGSYWRRISNFFAGLGWTINYWNARALPDGSWAFTESPWLNGVRTELMIAQLPPWPAQRSEAASDFSYQLVSYSQGSLGSLRRVRFGYDSKLFCTSRQEQCSTAGGTPFSWVSEPQTWTPCDGPDGCQIHIPAMPGKMLYYVEDSDDGSGNITSGAIKVAAVP